MNETRRLAETIAIVTGSSRGIGRAIALEFAQQGAKVAVTYHTAAKQADTVVEQILSKGGEAFSAGLDVRERGSVRELLELVLKRYGRIDVLVNNAGFLEQKPFMHISDEDWDYTVTVNLKSVFICTQEIMPFFERQRSGCIINISSVGGQMGGPKAPHYAAAKAGVISLTKSSARILSSSGVRVNAIAPGFIRTDMFADITSGTDESEIITKILLGTVGEPEDVAKAALFLASDEARYITGHVLNVNGGLYLGAGS